MNNPNFPNMMGHGMPSQAQMHQQTQLLNHYRSQTTPQGWQQQQLRPEERAHVALQLATSIRLAKPDMPDQEVMRWAINTENDKCMNSASKDEYTVGLKERLGALTQARQRLMNQNAAMMQQGNNMATQQMGMIGQANMQTPRPNQGQQFPQGFPNPQLQRPMQASPIPMSQAGSSMGMNVMNQQANQQPQAPAQPNMQRGPRPGQPPNFSHEENMRINQIAQMLMSKATPEQLDKFRAEASRFPPEKREEMQRRSIDPVFLQFRNQAAQMFQYKQRQAQQQMNQQVNQGGNRMMQQPSNQGMNMSGQQVGNNQGQMGTMNGNQDFDYAQIAGQQAEALRVQDAGQLVVPASNNQNANKGLAGFGSIGTPQPGQVSQPGQPQNMMGQQQQAFANAQARALQARNSMEQLQAQARAQATQQAQAQAQAKAQAQAQANAQAQMQAQSQMALRGQVGGLNMPPGPQSPAMPFLTRPMPPPGQQGGATPQQRSQPQPPQMTPHTAGQIDPRVAQALAQQAKQRAAAAQGQQLGAQNREALIPPGLNQVAKEQLLNLPEEKFRLMVERINQQRLQQPRNANQPPGFPGNQLQMGQPGMPITPQGLPIGGQGNPLMNGANMNAQRAMQIGQQMPGMNQQIQMQQQQRHQQHQRMMMAQRVLTQRPQIIAETDQTPFPSNILSAGMKQNLPEHIKTWSQLKQWASQNPTLAPEFNSHKLTLLQAMNYPGLMQALNMGGQQFPQQPNNAGGAPSSQPGGQAPQAQMVPPGMIPGQNQARPGPSMMPGMPPIPTVTPQELQMWRSRLPPAQAGISDDQLRQHIMNSKMAHWKRQQIQRHPMVQQGQMGQMPQTPMPPQPPQQTSRPPQAPPAQANQAPKPTRPQQPQKPTQENVQKGVKRPNDDVEVSGPEHASGAAPAPQAPNMMQNRSQQQHTQEQLKRQQQAIINAQTVAAGKHGQKPPSTGQQIPVAPGQTLNPEQKAAMNKKDENYKKLCQEVEQSTQRGQPVAHAPGERPEMQTLLRKNAGALKNLDKCLMLFSRFFDSPEGVLRNMLETRITLFRQFSKEGNLNDQMTLSKDQFTQALQRVVNFVSKVSSRFPQLQQQQPAGAQPQALQQPPQQQQPQTTTQAQLSADNLKRLEQQAIQQRNQSRGPAPPAPPALTADRPPFQFGAQSPRGAPIYANPQPDVNLRLPTNKKAKREHGSSQTSTPGQATPAPTSSPHIGVGKASPETFKKPQVEKAAEPPKPTFKCQDQNCDYSIRGFDTPAELEAHLKDAHAKIEDPLAFAIEQCAEAVGLNKDGTSKAPKPDPNATNRGAKIPHAPTKQPLQPAKQGQTPNIKESSTPAQAAATPMARAATQNSAIKSSPSSLLKTPQQSTNVKPGTPSTGKPHTPTPTPAKPVKEESKPEEKKEEDAWASVGFDQDSLKDIFATMDLPGTFTAASFSNEDTSWIPRSLSLSPATTPSSSKDSASTRESDISENDNLQISLGLAGLGDGAALGGDAWMGVPLGGETGYGDLKILEDLQSLGVGIEPGEDMGLPDLMDFDWEKGKLPAWDSMGEGVEGWGAGGAFEL